MKARKAKHGWLLTLIFSVISVLYMYPIILVFINSFKKKAYISRYPFKIPKGNMFVGWENYIRGLEKTGFFEAFLWHLIYYRMLGGSDCRLLFHVCVVYQ